MKLSKERFIQELNASLVSENIQLDEEKLNKLYDYKEILIEWNEKMNLTAITDDEEIIWKHFIDCIHTLRFIPDTSNVIDIGTGAGLPGIVIAICNTNVQVTLVDALQKRITFLNEIIGKLKLNNVLTVHARAEDLCSEANYREKYDIVISRAVASLNVLMELTAPYTKVGGKCIYMKADKLDEEIKASQNAIKVLNLEQQEVYEYMLKVEDNTQNRKIAVYLKKEITPKKYARQYAKIKKTPL